MEKRGSGKWRSRPGCGADAPDDGIEVITERDNVSKNDATSRFIRLEITGP